LALFGPFWDFEELFLGIATKPYFIVRGIDFTIHDLEFQWHPGDLKARGFWMTESLDRGFIRVYPPLWHSTEEFFLVCLTPDGEDEEHGGESVHFWVFYDYIEKLIGIEEEEAEVDEPFPIHPRLVDVKKFTP